VLQHIYRIPLPGKRICHCSNKNVYIFLRNLKKDKKGIHSNLTGRLSCPPVVKKKRKKKHNDRNRNSIKKSFVFMEYKLFE